MNEKQQQQQMVDKARESRAWVPEDVLILRTCEFDLRSVCHKCDMSRVEYSFEALEAVRVCPRDCGCNPKLNLKTAISWTAANFIRSTANIINKYESRASNEFDHGYDHLPDNYNVLIKYLKGLLRDVENNEIGIDALCKITILHRSSMNALHDSLFQARSLVRYGVGVHASVAIEQLKKLNREIIRSRKREVTV